MASPAGHIAGVLAALAGFSGGEDVVAGDKSVQAFLQHAECMVLQCAVTGGALTTSAGHAAKQAGEGVDCTVLFVKTLPAALEDVDAFRQHVITSTLAESVATSLAASVHRVYAPSLLRGSGQSGAGEGAHLPRSAAASLGALDTVLGSMADGAVGSGILVQEARFWSSKPPPASALAPVFEAVGERWASLGDAPTPASLLDLLADTLHTLEDVWNGDAAEGAGRFPQERMSALMTGVATVLAGMLAEAVWALPLWDPACGGTVRGVLGDAVQAAGAWLAGVKTLTEEQWQVDPDRPWSGPAPSMGRLADLADRLQSVLAVRSAHDELMHLLPPSRRGAAGQVLESLQGHGAALLSVDAAGDMLWKHAQSRYAAGVEPFEGEVAASLRGILQRATSGAAGGGGGRPLTAIAEFSRFKGLLDRPSIARALTGELEALAAQLTATVEGLEGQLDARRSRVVVDGDVKGLAPVVASIVWAAGVKARAKRLLEAAAPLLSKLPSWGGLASSGREVAAACDSWAKDLFAEWCGVVREHLVDDPDGDFALHASGRVMDFDASGGMVVRYSEALVVLLRQVRQLRELGYRVPSKVARAVADAEEYFRYAVMLKKVASFYNTMNAIIIPTTKPMLLGPLAEFEDLVQNGHGGASGGSGAVTWSNPEECARFVSALQRAADRVATANKRLRKTHAWLGETAVTLMDLSPLRQRDTFRRLLTNVHSQVSALVREGRFTPDQLRRWCTHWDAQLFKAVECGYRWGCESLNESLGEIKAELTLQGGRLAFRPPLEELRAAYYGDMRRFLAMPATLQGLLEAATGGSGKAQPHPWFGRMAQVNSPSVLEVFRKAEILFARVSKVADGYKSWEVLGKVDLDALVAAMAAASGGLNGAMFGSILDSVKAKRKEVDKLPDTTSVDCVTLSLVPLKSALGDALARVNDGVALAVRREVSTQLKEVEDWLADAASTLATRPTSIDEIATAQVAAKDISAAMGGMEAAWKGAEEGKRMLQSILAADPRLARMVDVSDLVSRAAALPDAWGAVAVSLEAFDSMVEEQRTELKASLQGRIAEHGQAIDRFAARWAEMRPEAPAVWDAASLGTIFATLEGQEEELKKLVDTAGELDKGASTFDLRAPDWGKLQAVKEDVAEAVGSWAVYKEYDAARSAIADADWISFRGNVFALTDFAQEWSEKMKAAYRGGGSGGSGLTPVENRILTECNAILRAQNAWKYARGEPFKEEHWKQVFAKLRMPRGTTLETLKVRHFLADDTLAELASAATWLKELTSRALGEVSIREALSELHAWMQTAEFSTMQHESAVNGAVTPLVKDWRELFTALGDNMSLLGSLNQSPYFKPFADTAAQYGNRMGVLDDCATKLNSIQRRWVYLEPVFGRGALPSEQPRFQRVHSDFRDIMARIAASPQVFNITDEALFPSLGSQLGGMLEQLERCQKALSAFLDEKRAAMPRFYFLGDEDLLEILGQASNPSVIQAHLKKLFQGIHRVVLDGGAITAMRSVAGEEVPMVQPVPVSDDVTAWLGALVRGMRDTLRESLVQAVAAGPSRDLTAFPSQVLQLATSVEFTRDAEAALSAGGSSALEDLKRHLQSTLTGLVSGDSAGNKVLSLKIKALVLDLVHYMDVVDQLLRGKADGPGHWVWQKQLRFYLEGGQCLARMVDATMEYTYEYQGNASKLVHTPLTDKCFLTLTQGMKYGYGGNPYGPAGTGKTESVKALGGALGRQTLVFNCDEGIDFQSMGRIFTGLVKCGAWGCFDEFNRLKADQLSAVSQQIQVIQAALKQKSSTLSLLGRTIEVDTNAGIFVTMNPAGKGYGGRSKLPDNLKQLFRPVAMSRPDNELIAEVILYSEGFTAAKALAGKVTSLFTLSSQLLTPQQHYDWGLRALKACLNTGGKLITAAKVRGEVLDSAAEGEILIQAVRVNTLSKLTFADAQTFLGLVKDVFPGVRSSDVRSAELEAAMREVMVAPPFNLIVDEGQIRKMLQLKESIDQRMGCVIVGPSGCGKSTLWRVLKAAMEKTGVRVVTHVMNPKAMPRSQLLGSMDHDTREWTDGVLTGAARSVVKEPMETRAWVVCDGDVDPEWIESLNSVLDDNHLLTLPNGERISFGSNVNFLFETHDLQFASPATISRMGMIYLSDDDVDVKRNVSKWLAGQPEDLRPAQQAWMDEVFYASLDWAQSHKAEGAEVVETTLVGTVLNGLSQVAQAQSKPAFALGVVRGLGGNMDPSTRASFAKFVFGKAGVRAPDPMSPLNCALAPGGESLVSLGSVSDGADVDPETGAVVTPTVLQVSQALQPWVKDMVPFILVGPEGCGKAVVVKHALASQRGTTVTTLHCNAATRPEHVIQKLRQSCGLFTAPTGRVFRPREGDRMVLFVKDINLPRPDMYGTCALIAFLQQLLTFNGFYDEGLEFLGLERVHLVCTMTPSTTMGRHALSPRFTAAMRIAVMGYPGDAELAAISAAVLRSTVGAEVTDPGFTSAAAWTALGTAMVEVYKQMRAKFSVDDARHYQFTPRDLTEWATGLGRYDLAGGESVMDAWAWEGARRFRDALMTAKDRQTFDAMLAAAARTAGRGGGPGLAQAAFTSLTGGPAPAALPVHAPAPGLQRVSMSDLQAFVERGIVVYEREERELGLELFPEVLHHIAQADRVLSQPGGSLLLAGRPGVGRRSAVALAAHMTGLEYVSAPVTRAYTPKAWRNEVKRAVTMAGAEGKGVLLYVEDHHASALGDVLETVNSLLAGGEVPGLYAHEELEGILGPVREAMSEEGGDFRTPYALFVARVKRHLHVAVGMDPTAKEYAARLQANPALVTRCTVLWWGSWEREALRAVPAKMLASALASTAPVEASESKGGGAGSAPDDHDVPAVDTVLDVMIAMHEGVSNVLGAGAVCPRDYLTFARAYSNMLSDKQAAVQQELGHLQGGLSKLQEAQATVDELNQGAAAQRDELTVAQAAADEAMEGIKRTLQEAGDRRGQVEVLSTRLQAAEEETLQQKASIEKELSEVQPLLERAQQALGAIDSKSLGEVRALRNPPEVIADILSAVLSLLGQQDLTWRAMKRFLGQRGVTEQIIGFDAHHMTAATHAQVTKMVRAKAKSFEPATAKRASAAVAPMAEWVHANLKYYTVLQDIQPLEGRLKAAEEQLAEGAAALEANQAELATIDDRVATLQAEFAKKTGEAEGLKAKLAKTEETVQRADSLLGKLGGEKTRWEATVRDLVAKRTAVPWRVLLAAGFVAYLGGASEDTRAAVVKQWAQAVEAMSGGAASGGAGHSGASEGKDGGGVPAWGNFAALMSSESEQLKWKAGGLPGDALSIENAITILQSNAAARRAPFIIDPSTAATAWLEGQLNAAEGKAEVLPAGDARWSTQVELAVRFGKTLLIRDCDGVEAALYSVLRRDLYQIGGRNMVWVGDKQVDFNDSFALYMTTRNPAPQLPPDARALVNVVNFSVTRSGLEGQLLSATIQHERPELEARKSALLKEEEDLKMQLADLERDLVQNLATSTGNLLENTALIESLSATKSKSADIGTSLQGSARAAVELDQQRNTYRPFAEAGAQLYFLVQALTRANHMYQFSLAAFSRMFKQTLEAGVGGGSVQDAGAGDTAARIASLIPSLQNRALLTIGRSLLKGDRLMFALHVVHGTHGRCFGTNEWEFFVGELVPDVGAGVDPSFPSWAPPDRGALFTLLLRTFPSLARACNFDGSASEWKAWGASPNPEQRFPGAAAGVTGWQRVLLIQVLRPDRLVTALAGFVCDTLRLPSVDPPAMQWGDMYASESDKNTPILLITTTGADPTADLRDFAASAVGAAKYRELAMGGGQQAAAEAMVREAAEAGAWVCLKNVHLVVSWLPALEKLLSALPETTPDTFRLWLTTETHDEFPPILLQSSMKVTFESPPGLKKNLQRTLESWSPEYISGQAVLPRSHGGGGSTPPTTPVALLRSQLLFLMAWFHAVVQERRTYVPQGWTKGYEFSTADLRAGATLVDDLIASLPPDMDASSVPWAFFHGLMESAVYGCRVDNGYDARVMRVYLRRMFHPSVLSKAVGGGGRPLTGSALSHPLTLPDSTNAADYSRMVDGLPDLDVPAVFGLPPNIDRSVQRAIALRVTASLRSLSVAASSGGGFNRSAWKAALGPVIDLWGKIVPTDIMPTLQQAESAAERGGGEGVDPDPMGQFVFLEAARGARVVRRVSDDLNALKQVLFGVGLLTRRTQSVAEALLANALPGAWIRHWKDGPEDPRVWLRGTVERCHALATKWLPGLGRGGESSRLLASPVNLGHLFRPGTFLEAYRQVSARQLGTSMDGLALQSAMDAGQLKEVGAASSVAIEGLILQGAVWDGSRLAHADASTAEAVPMRPVYVTWLPPSAGEVYPPRTTVTTPVYTGLTRETFVTRLSLPIPADSTMTWIQAGVALLLGSD